MAPKTPTNLYYTVPLNDDELESQDYYLWEKTPTAPWFSVPVRSDAVAIGPRSSPLSALKEKLWSLWSNDSTHHNDGDRVNGGKGFWGRWIWLVHAVLLTISMTLFALSVCTLQTAANTTAAQCQAAGEGTNSNGASSFVPRSFFDEEVTDTTAPAVVLPVPIVVPELQHIDMEVSVDDRTSVEDVD